MAQAKKFFDFNPVDAPEHLRVIRQNRILEAEKQMQQFMSIGKGHTRRTKSISVANS
jgi:hypothetical protein